MKYLKTVIRINCLTTVIILITSLLCIVRQVDGLGDLMLVLLMLLLFFGALSFVFFIILMASSNFEDKKKWHFINAFPFLIFLLIIVLSIVFMANFNFQPF